MGGGRGGATTHVSRERSLWAMYGVRATRRQHLLKLLASYTSFCSEKPMVSKNKTRQKVIHDANNGLEKKRKKRINDALSSCSRLHIRFVRMIAPNIQVTKWMAQVAYARDHSRRVTIVPFGLVSSALQPASGQNIDFHPKCSSKKKKLLKYNL